MNSKHNIHIGGYDKNLQALQPGKVVVGGDIDMTAENGSIAVTVDTSAKNIKLNSKNLNIMTDGKAVMTADTYEFTAKNYIGGVKNQKALIRAMEKYSTMPSISEKSFVEIAGGDLNKLETGDTGYAFVRSNGNMNVNGVNAANVNLSANQADIVIKDNVHANQIIVDGETKNLTVALPNRDYLLKYTNIKDTEVITINPDAEITYDMANGENGWNNGTQTEENTYLVVPGNQNPPVDPDPTDPPVDPDPTDPPVDPDPVDPPVDPDPTDPPILPDDDENIKTLRNLHKDTIARAIDAFANSLGYARVIPQYINDADEMTRMRYSVETGFESGYKVFSLLPVYEGIPVYPYVTMYGSDTGRQAAGVSFARNLDQEEIVGTLYNGEVVQLQWRSPFTVTQVENENVPLLPFERIMEIFKRQVFMSVYCDQGHPITYKITAIQFSYMRVQIKDSDDYYLLPVWDFTGYMIHDWQMSPGDMAVSRGFFHSMSILTINAVDGSVLDRYLGY